MKARLALVLIAVLAMAAGMSPHLLERVRKQGPAGGTNLQILQMNLADADGKPQPIQQWTGKILVINYWATWCPPCIEEMPGFSRMHQQYSGKGVQFIGIGIDVPDKIRQFRDSKKITYPLLVAGMGAISTSVELGNKSQALPFTVILNPQREVIAVKLGRWQEADLEQVLNKAILP